MPTSTECRVTRNDVVTPTFIPIEQLSSASSRKLFEGGPDSSAAKKNSPQMRKERVY